MNAPVTTTAGNGGEFNEYEIVFYQPTRADSARDASNRFADEAMQMGLRGFEITAQRCALLADVYAQLADIYAAIDHR